ncbi:MAG TPA: hypothetical protein VJ926_00655 [Patescibacteria group bacterium]|nr:hypothetical protein [Patescibacteria group bacterium]
MPEKEQGQLNNNKAKSLDKKESSVISTEAEKRRARIKVKINSFFSVYFKFAILIIVLVIFFSSYVYILKPKYDTAVEAVKGNIISQERVYLLQLNKLNKFKQLVAAYNKIPTDEKDKLNNLLPPDYIKEQLFIELGYIIPQKGYNLSHLDFKKDKEMESEQEGQRNVNTKEEKTARSFLNELPSDIGYIDANLKVSVVTYNGVRNLLKILENNLRLIDIYKVSFDPEGENLELSFVTYYLKEDK